MKILAIDFGEHKIGLAISQSMLLVQEYGTVRYRDPEEALKALENICKEEKIDQIVIGLPKTPSGEDGPQAERIKDFAASIKKKLKISIHFEDETLTSEEAQRILKEEGADLDETKERVDQMSAKLILQQYLSEQTKEGGFTRRVVALILAIAIGVGIGFSFFVSYQLKKHHDLSNKIIFEVKEGQGVSQIAQNLKDTGLVDSKFAFIVFTFYSGSAKKMQVGAYALSPSMTIPQIANKIASGDVAEYRVTIPEGYASWQIAQLLEKKKIVKASEIEPLLQENEGYLFPDTYSFSLEITAPEIIAKMKEDFDKKTVGLKIDNETLILASIVERESKKDEDRPMVAEVYLNRLAKGMKLEADPTINYAKKSWDQISVSDYTNIDSPYNTYLHTGLPPGPICNPGLKSIQAVLNPVQHDYLYFFHLKDGSTIFSKTEEEHNQNKKTYLSQINN